MRSRDMADHKGIDEGSPEIHKQVLKENFENMVD